MAAGQNPPVDRIPFIIGTAGHIDHGKTALVRALTGMDTDRLIDEKRRGVSIDLGFAYCDFPSGGTGGRAVRAAIVDVPGHERFIRNMLAGITGIDMVLFVVAADDGVMPQTREHLDIVNLLGVTSGVFIITKADLAGPERLDEVRGQIEELIEPTALAGSPVVAVSAATGDGVEALKRLVGERLAPRDASASRGLFRLPVDRSFSVKGFGAVVTGTVASGSIARGEQAILFPTGATVRVRGIQSLYMDADRVTAGQRAAVNLSAVSHREVERGFVVASPALAGFAAFARRGETMKVDCVLDLLGGAKPGGRARARRPIRNHAELKVHHFTGEALARVVFPGRKLVAPGSRLPARLVLKRPLLMLRGDRFILRDPATNTTVGGGEVSVPYLDAACTPAVGRLAAAAGEGVGPVSVLSDIIEKTGRPGVELAAASLMLNAAPTDLEGALTEGAAGLGVMGGYVVSLERAEAVTKAAVEAVRAHHAGHPSEAGLDEGRLAGELGSAFRAEPALMREIVAGAVARGLIRRTGSTLSMPSHRPGLTGRDALIEKDILRLGAKGLRPIGAAEVEGLPYGTKEVEKVLRYLVERGELVRLKAGTYLSGEAVEGARALLVAHLGSGGEIRAAEFRDLIGCGRKLAIEILEYFDTVGLTLRKGDVRTLRG
ncbi:MAG: selenocysteine-specific translation elongation factor [Thermodesulfobacteriota bacterium]